MAILESLNIVNVVESEGFDYYVFNSHEYVQDKIYTIGKGTYIFRNISQEHPIAILNNHVSNKVTYTGDQSKTSNKDVIGTTSDSNYDFYYGDITLTVTEDFGDNLSIYCFRSEELV